MMGSSRHHEAMSWSWSGHARGARCCCVMCGGDEEIATTMGPDHIGSWFLRKKGRWRIDGPHRLSDGLQ